MLLALFGANGGLGLAVNLIFLFIVVIWLALVYWTYADAKRRMDDQVLIMCATAASAFPFLGTIVYVILRPPEFLEDAHERDLEIRATELRVRQLAEQSCPHCEFPIEKSYLRCPNCRRRVKDPCANCSRPLDPRWGVCPYCEAEVQRRQPQRRAPAQQRRGAQQRQGQAAPAEGQPAQQRQATQQRPKQQRQAAKKRPQEAKSSAQRKGGTRPAATS